MFEFSAIVLKDGEAHISVKEKGKPKVWGKRASVIMFDKKKAKFKVWFL
jgi:hypothetical protein